MNDTDTFRHDGVVVMRNVVSPDWIERMRVAVNREVDTPTVVDLTAMAGAPDDGVGAPRGQFRAA